MDLRQLRYFRAVAEERHLTRAAERLGLRGTSLSQQILALERDLGVELFRRTTGGMVPTAAAMALLPRAVALLEAADQAARVARDAAAGRRVLRVGVTPGSPPHVIPVLWEAARDLDIEPEFLDLPTSSQAELLRMSGLDLGLMVLPADLAGLDATLVSDEPLGVLVADSHPLACRSSVTFADLEGMELLWFRRDLAPGYHDEVLDACRTAGWVPERVRERPAREGLFAAELRYGRDLVALRPAWAAIKGTAWVPLAGEPPRVRHVLAHGGTALVSDLLRQAFPPRSEASPRGQRAR
ncbi:LysR family transcriptional regulator [Nonomuraea sediminis]|uniref:LysR family transcriptional regulator n=1 Tax=Nonomuraea sediminis TaxID=2835864 RepID=UPI001BDD79F9|nr:LysR family transcriptional regulator [Nonomuraea sediminis]